jgi:uncharacterized phage protein (TIGR01671 family)
MNKFLKFRAWDIDTSKMFYREGLTICDFIKEGYLAAKENCIPWMLGDSNFVIQQFIGLKDKNNKDIYEGDILSDTNTIIECKYIAPQFMFLYKINTIDGLVDTFIRDISAIKNFQIIGNIFENPELNKVGITPSEK